MPTREFYCGRASTVQLMSVSLSQSMSDAGRSANMIVVVWSAEAPCLDVPSALLAEGSVTDTQSIGDFFIATIRMMRMG